MPTVITHSATSPVTNMTIVQIRTNREVDATLCQQAFVLDHVGCCKFGERRNEIAPVC